MSLQFSTATLAVLALGLAGCGPAASRADAPAIVPVPLQAQQAPPTSTPPPTAAPLQDGAVVPIAVLVDLALQANPNRQIFEANRAAAIAAVRQAAAWANPELEFHVGRATAREADNNGQRPTNTLGGVDLKQRFEIPGKRSARIDAAEASRFVTEREAALDRLDLEIEVRAAALAVASSAVRAAHAAHGLELSTQVHAAAERRLQAGDTDRGDLARARVDLANAQLALNAAQIDAEASRVALRTWCGDGLPERFSVAGILSETPSTVALVDVQQRATAAHPRLAIYDAQLTATSAAVAAEQRTWYPDLTIGVSGSRETDTNDVGVSVGMDLPLWNRNQGGIAAARSELARLQAEQRRELLALQRAVATAWNAYDRERQQIAVLSSTVIPATNEALALKLAAYQAGDASLLEVIDARQMALNADIALTESRERAAQARIDLHRAVGVDPISPTASTAPIGVQP